MAPLPHEIDALNSFLSLFFVPTQLPRQLHTHNETNEFKRSNFCPSSPLHRFARFTSKEIKTLPSPRFEPPTSESTGEYWPTGPRCPASPNESYFFTDNMFFMQNFYHFFLKDAKFLFLFLIFFLEGDAAGGSAVESSSAHEEGGNVFFIL